MKFNENSNGQPDELDKPNSDRFKFPDIRLPKTNAYQTVMKI